MTTYTQQISGTTYQFDGLVELMATASPQRSGDELAGCAASSDAERAAAQWALADVLLETFLEDLLVPYETDEVTRLIVDSHDRAAFAPLAHLTVGGLRDWLLEVAASPGAAATLASVAAGLTPEMVAAVSKLMR
ncbi:ethanolamine ammonia-lyase subunit EutB, partial [Dietzia sp. CW19]